MEVMLDPVSRALANAPVEDEEISDEEIRAVEHSREWFKNNQGTSLEDVATELGFRMDEIRTGQARSLKHIRFSEDAKADIRASPQHIAMNILTASRRQGSEGRLPLNGRKRADTKRGARKGSSF
jgi:hypothetical protein